MQTQCTPVRRGLCVPSGTLLIHTRWKDTELSALLKKKIDLSYMGDIGVADFHPSSHTCVIYITEKDLISTTNSKSYKMRVAKLRNSKGFSERYVLLDKTDLTSCKFMEIQNFVVLNCDMNIIPVDGWIEAANFLALAVSSAMRTPSRNPFLKKSHPVCIDKTILSVVQKFPKVGSTKAKLLLERFGSIEGITNASTASLAQTVGDTAAKQLHVFLTLK